MTTAENPMPESESNEPAEDNVVSLEPTQEDELARLSAEASKYKDQWMRTAAEMDNIRKRSQRELEEANKYAVTSFARDMVEVLENLTRASESIPQDQREGMLKTLGEGVDLTLRELLSTFNRHGINRIFPLDQKFDHNFHQAVVQVERADVPPGTVVQVVQSGYIIHDRLLRPAMVAVSKAPEMPVEKVDTTA